MSERIPVRLSGVPIIDKARCAEFEARTKMFSGIPDRWYDSPTWRCKNGHVSKRFLKSEVCGDVCLASGCGAHVYLTFPEDTETER